MNIHLFNASLAIGWTMLVVGLCLWSVPAGLAMGGAVLMIVTLKLAFRAGVQPPGKPDQSEG